MAPNNPVPVEAVFPNREVPPPRPKLGVVVVVAPNNDVPVVLAPNKLVPVLG